MVTTTREGMHEALERVEAPTPLRRRPIVR
jgi:hypothetical protein